MWGRILTVLGFLWALPITSITVWYVLFCWAMGWYRYLGWRERAFVWCHRKDRLPKWLSDLWTDWAGHCVGSLIVVKHDPAGSDYGARMLRHELEHARQMNILGIFQPLTYMWVYLLLKVLGPRNLHPYYDNPFEIGARREAHQLIDVYGAIQKSEQPKK